MIKGERVILRGIERDDTPRLWAWGQDEEIMRLRNFPVPPESLTAAEKEFEESLGKETGGLRLAISTLEGKLIGEVALRAIDQRAGDAEFSIAIGDKEYWGHGYGTDATRTLMRYAFNQLNLHRVTLYVHDFNQRAIRAYEKCGFVIEGRLRDAEYMDGVYSDVLVMGLLRRDFEESERHRAEEPAQTPMGISSG